jgi:hypothetical protein
MVSSRQKPNNVKESRDKEFSDSKVGKSIECREGRGEATPLELGKVPNRSSRLRASVRMSRKAF